MASTELATRAEQQIKEGCHMFSTTTLDDNVIMKQIQATHAPDLELDVKPLLHHVKGILLEGVSEAKMDGLEEKTNHMIKSLAYAIHKISCEISCKCSSSGDEHAATLTLFLMLSSYKWDAKVVLALAAFVVNYGEFWLVTQSSTTAESVGIMKHSISLKSRFDDHKKLVETMLDVTNCIVEVKELPNHYITPAAYWTIRSVVACATQIVGRTGLGYECMILPTEDSELSNLDPRVRNIYDKLKEQFSNCNKHRDESRYLGTFKKLTGLLKKTDSTDNTEILTALINATNDKKPLNDRFKETKEKVGMDVLSRKTVLMLISDLDIYKEELEILEHIFNESHNQYEVVWLPIVDKSTDDINTKKFDELVWKMPWYKVYNLSFLDWGVIRYIKEEWHFSKRPLLVALDAQGKVVCLNAIHMTFIWRNKAFPFSSKWEEELWKKETWRLEFLVENIDNVVLNWIKEEKYICLYGGEDIKWIEEFREKTTTVTKEANIDFEMVYVGKSKPKERVIGNILKIIEQKKLGYCLRDINSIWYFWVRLESMWYSKMQCGKTVQDDKAMKEMETILTFNSSDQGWAVIGKGSTENLIKANSKTLLDCFTSFDSEKVKDGSIDFLQAIEIYMKNNRTDHHCNRLIFSRPTWEIPEKMTCAECGRIMEKCTMYRCCTD